MDPTAVPAARFFQALGIIGSMLQNGEARQLPQIRTVLVHKGYEPYEISVIFDSLKNGHIRGIGVDVQKDGSMVYWTLRGAARIR